MLLNGLDVEFFNHQFLIKYREIIIIMARVTIDDCIEKVGNHFDLTLLAVKRALQISDGSRSYVPIQRDKPAVIALREISEGFVNHEVVEEQEKRKLEEQREFKYDVDKNSVFKL